MPRESYVDRARGLGVLDVARRLGLRTTPARGSHGGTASCTACGRERRNASTPGERRGAIGIRPEGAGWHCHPCGASGDALDLVSWSIGGSRFRDLSTSARAEVRKWFDGGASAPAYAPAAVQTPARLPEYPTRDAGALWRACGPVTRDAEVAGYLRARGIDPAAVARLDLARALPVDVTPAWARHRLDDGPAQPWAETGHRLIVPMRDLEGGGRNVNARCVRSSPRKSSACGRRAGLVMATPGAFHAAVLVVREGEVDYLTTAATGAATVGIVSGSWTLAHAERLAHGCELHVDTDDDDAGAAYAQHIVNTLTARPDVRVVLADHFEVHGHVVALKASSRAA